VAPADFIGFGSVDPPGRPAQLFLEKSAGTGRGIQEQHAAGFGAYFPGCGTPRGSKAQVPGPPTVNSSSILKVNFAALYVGRLVVVARWDVVSVLAGAVFSNSMMLSPVSPPNSLSAAERPGAMLKIEPLPGGTIKPFLTS
jgi:hypothetical protein